MDADNSALGRWDIVKSPVVALLNVGKTYTQNQNNEKIWRQTPVFTASTTRPFV